MESREIDLDFRVGVKWNIEAESRIQTSTLVPSALARQGEALLFGATVRFIGNSPRAAMSATKYARRE